MTASALRPPGPVPDRALRFTALGDSTTTGIGDRPAPGRPPGWAARLTDLLDRGVPGTGCVLVNLARNGARLSGVRHEQLPWALATRPHLASVVAGGNDVLRGDLDIARLRGHLDEVIGALHDQGATVLVATLPQPGRTVPLPGAVAKVLSARIAAVNAAYVDLAREHGALLLDVAAHPAAAARSTWHVDRIHPGVAGHRLLADGFAELLSRHGWPVAPPLDAVDATAAGRRAQLAWLLRHGSPWLARRTVDLVPTLALLATRQAVVDGIELARRRPRVGSGVGGAG